MIKYVQLIVDGDNGEFVYINPDKVTCIEREDGDCKGNPMVGVSIDGGYYKVQGELLEVVAILERI